MSDFRVDDYQHAHFVIRKLILDAILFLFFLIIFFVIIDLITPFQTFSSILGIFISYLVAYGSRFIWSSELRKDWKYIISYIKYILPSNINILSRIDINGESLRDFDKNDNKNNKLKNNILDE